MTRKSLCKICSEETEETFQIDGYSIQECRQCCHRQTTLPSSDEYIPNTYNDSYFFEGGAGYPNYFEEKNLLIEHGRYYAALFENPGILLDVGCAAGFLMKGFQEKGWKVIGIEPNQTMVDYGQQKLNLEIHQGSIEKLTLNQQVDLALMIQVMGHFVDPNPVMKQLKKLVKADGLVLVETWNFCSLSARILGKRWHEYSPPSILHWYSPKSLDLLFDKYGFSKVETGRPQKRISGRHFKSLFSYKYGSFLVNWIPYEMKIPYPTIDLFYTIYRKYD